MLEELLVTRYREHGVEEEEEEEEVEEEEEEGRGGGWSRDWTLGRGGWLSGGEREVEDCSRRKEEGGGNAENNNKLIIVLNQ